MWTLATLAAPVTFVTFVTLVTLVALVALVALVSLVSLVTQVIGNVCKILTVLINISIWDHHASPFGIGCLFICLTGAGVYQQVPRCLGARARRECVVAH